MGAYCITQETLLKEGIYTSPGLMHESGCSGPVHWDDPEGWGGEGGGEGGSGCGTYVHLLTDSCQCMAKTPTIL